jgi:hypothetical protein
VGGWPAGELLRHNNFGSKVIGQLDGFNYGGSRAEIVVTSKWVNEFKPP